MIENCKACYIVLCRGCSPWKDARTKCKLNMCDTWTIIRILIVILGVVFVHEDFGHFEESFSRSYENTQEQNYRRPHL